jgi:undecaprenyl-diphosphatase
MVTAERGEVERTARSAENRLAAVLCVVGIVGFALIALAVFKGPGRFSLDLDIATRVPSLRTPVLTTVFYSATFLGNTDTLVVASLALLVVGLVDRRLRRDVTCLLVVLIAVAIGSEVLKAIFVRPRPAAALALVHETSWSFPSGHAMVSLSVLGFLAWRAASRPWATVACLALALLIGTSRVYLGVHYTCDVLAGYMAALPVIAGATVLYRRLAPAAPTTADESQPSLTVTPR